MALFTPTRADVYSTRALLASRKLPNELVLCILDHARYWVEYHDDRSQLTVLLDEAFSSNFSAARPYSASLTPACHDQRKGGELLKIKEVEFLVVSHDQGWTTEDTRGTYQTSSWFEVSILRPSRKTWERQIHDTFYDPNTGSLYAAQVYPSVSAAMHTMFPAGGVQLLRRPSKDPEPQRLHCREMIEVSPSPNGSHSHSTSKTPKEGDYAWYLQGNEVARDLSVFEGEMVRRYTVVWSSASNPRFVGNEGSGTGEGFVDTVRERDWIVIWARAKVRRANQRHVIGKIFEELSP